MALTHQLPIIIHSRSATDETLKALERYAKEPLRGIVHCFSDDYAIAQEYVKHNFVVGLGGTITYPKNEALRIVAKELPIENIVLETDAPYLSPQSLRGTNKLSAQYTRNCIIHCRITQRNSC